MVSTYTHVGCPHPIKLNYYDTYIYYKKLGGGVTENFEFEMGTDTEVYDSCSAMLNGETFIFGGNKEKKQVIASKPITCYRL